MTAFTEDWNLSQFWYDLSLLKNELRTVQKYCLYLQISPLDLDIIYLFILSLENVVQPLLNTRGHSHRAARKISFLLIMLRES